MAQLDLNVGSNANDGTGDTLRGAMQKVNTMFTELYDSPMFSANITISDNNITANRSNDDLVLTPNGTGAVAVAKIIIDENISIEDNEIQTTQSNSDLLLSASGSGKVRITNVDINSGAIDGAVIGANTAAAGTFTAITVNTSMTIDNLKLDGNTISSTNTNRNITLSPNGTGKVSLSGILFPNADGSANQILRTDGSGALSFVTLTASSTLTHSDINDNTATVTTSTTSQVDSFNSATHRSAKYFISIADATNSRFEIVEANVIHGPSADSTIEAYVTAFGNTSSHSSPLCTFTADVKNGLVRLLATNNGPSSCIFKFQRTLIDL